MEIKFRSANPDKKLDTLLSTVECEIIPRKGETVIIGSKMLEVAGMVHNFDANCIEVYLTDWNENDESELNQLNN